MIYNWGRGREQELEFRGVYDNVFFFNFFFPFFFLGTNAQYDRKNQKKAKKNNKKKTQFRVFFFSFFGEKFQCVSTLHPRFFFTRMLCDFCVFKFV